MPATPGSSPCSTPMAWPARPAGRGIASASIADTEHRCSTTAACAAAGSSTPSPIPRWGHSLPARRDHADPPRRRPGRARDNAARGLDRNPLGDQVVEADGLDQDAGEEGVDHPDPDDPPRSRANGRRGHGTFANDRPPVAGMVGRESGEIRLEVVGSANANRLGELVDGSCLSGATVNTDEWCGYGRVGGHHGRIHVTVDHSGPRSTYAIDADGDGVREVHCNTMEGTWTGLRNFLRPFRGLSKWCLSQ